jgi:hypothetical protein
MAEFKDPDAVLHAAESVRAAGYTKIEAYTPFPIHHLDEAVGANDIWVPWVIFLSGLAGGAFGYWLQWWINTSAYPLNVGGRPFHSWPSFIPATFECTVLAASFGAFFGMLALNGLPRPYHPVFNAPRFELASQDRFFLCIEADDPKFNIETTWQLLKNLGADAVSEVQP